MIRITESAKDKIVDILAAGGSKERLRFGLRGGGCNGFEYYLSLDENPPEEDDIIIPVFDRYEMIVDSMSMMYLENTEIDYKRDLLGECFAFNNPNSIGKCGCGSSVSF